MVIVTAFLSKTTLSEIFVHNLNADFPLHLKAHINIHLNSGIHN